VARDFIQHYKVDYKKIFTSTLKFTIFHTLFALAAFFDMKIEQIDFMSVYLYSELDEIIYVEQSPSFVQENMTNEKPNLV